MTVYVLRPGRNGKLVLIEKPLAEIADRLNDALAKPHVSRFEAFESPVTGASISSWRQRDADMTASGAVDPRDLSGDPFQKRAERNARRTEPGKWGGPSD